MKKLKLFLTLLLVCAGINMTWAEETETFETSDAPNGTTFVEGTKWYTIKFRKSGKGYITTSTLDATGFKLTAQSVEQNDTHAQWCFVGNSTTGYKIYNRNSGTSKCLGFEGYDGNRNGEYTAKMLDATADYQKITFKLEHRALGLKYATNNMFLNPWNDNYIRHWLDDANVGSSDNVVIFELVDTQGPVITWDATAEYSLAMADGYITTEEIASSSDGGHSTTYKLGNTREKFKIVGDIDNGFTLQSVSSNKYIGYTGHGTGNSGWNVYNYADKWDILPVDDQDDAYLVLRHGLEKGLKSGQNEDKTAYGIYTDGEKAGDYRVIIKKIEAFDVKETDIYLGKGESKTITTFGDGEVTWSSDNEAIATVSGGVVTACNAITTGEAVITAVSSGIARTINVHYDSYGWAISDGEEPMANVGNRYLTTVATTDALTNLSYTDGTYPGNLHYTDATNLTLEARKESNVTLTFAGPASMKGTKGKAWIDWNCDGVFDETSEMAFEFGTLNSETADFATGHECTFTVPSTAVLGNSRLRLVFAANNTAGQNTVRPTGHTSLGYTIDFKVVIAESEKELKRVELSEACTAFKSAIYDAYDSEHPYRIGNGYNQYHGATVDEVSGMISGIESMVTANASSLAEYTAKLGDLNTLKGRLAINLPADGAFVRVRCAGNGFKYLNSATSGDQEMGAKGELTSIWCYNDGKLVSYADGRTLGAKDLSPVGTAYDITFAENDNFAFYGRYSIKVTTGTNDNYFKGTAATLDMDETLGTGAEYSWWLENANTIPVKITTAKYASFYSPKVLTPAEGEEVTIYTAVRNGEYLTLTAVDEVPARQGVILYKNVETETTVQFNVTGTSSATSALKGTVQTIAGNTNDYVLSRGTINGKSGTVGFFQMREGENKQGFKAFYEEEAAVGVRAFAFAFDELATAIEAAKSETMTEGVTYNLNGQRVQKTGGLVIVNGKKVMVK